MPTDLVTTLREELQIEGVERSRYTREAYQLVPSLLRPRILDIGCGAGMPTLELARLSGGEIVGIDIDQTSLERFTARMEAAGFSDRVRAVKCSMFHMAFRDASFDIIWAEGSIGAIGFERGLREWRRFLRPRGFVVVHEAVWLQPSPPREIREHWERESPGIMTVPDCLEAIQRCGYELITHYALPEDTWWTEYFGPLQVRVQQLRARWGHEPEVVDLLDREQGEVEMYKKSQSWYGSAFFIMRGRWTHNEG